MNDLEILEGRPPIEYDPCTEYLHIPIYKGDECIGKIIVGMRQLKNLMEFIPDNE